MENIIGVKELYKNLSKISEQLQKGESFIVVKRSKPIFRIIPYRAEKKKKYTLKDFKKLQFKGSGDLSQKIDEIVYKIKK